MHPGDRELAWKFFVAFLVLTTVHFAAKSVRQATFIDSLGSENLPWVYLALAVASLPVLLLYSRLASRFRISLLMVGGTLLHVLGLVVFFLLFGLERPWVAVAYYIWLGMAFAIAVSQFWSYANQVCDPRQARRLFSFIGAGGLLGSVLGGVVAVAVTRAAGTRPTLLAAAAIMLLLPLSILVIDRHHAARRDRTPIEIEVDYRRARGGLRTLVGSRLLVLIAWLMLLTMMVGQLVSWQFFWYLEQSTEYLDQRTSSVAFAYILMGCVGFGFQLLVTGRIHRILGVAFGMRVLPGAVTALQLTVVLAAALSSAGMVWILVWVVFIAEGSLRHSVDQASRELLFVPVAEELRLKAKAFIDIFIQRFGKSAAAILILVTLQLLTVGWVSFLTLVLAAVWLTMIERTRREYVTAFRAGLKSGLLEPDTTIDPRDVTTLTTLVHGLGSPDQRRVLHAMQLLSDSGEGRLVPPLMLHHENPEVRLKTLDVLRDARREDAAPLVERAIQDPDAEVRTKALQTLAALRGEQAATLALALLDDPDPRLRTSAAVSLLAGSEGTDLERVDGVLAELSTSDDSAVRAEAARALGQVPDPIASDLLVQLLYDRDLAVVRAAITAVGRRFERGGPNPLYATILVCLMGNRRLKLEARDALVAQGSAAIPPLLHFMRSPDEQIWVRRAVPKTVALIGAQEGADALVDNLDAEDQIVRSKVIEALVFMRTRGSQIAFRRREIARHLQLEAERYLRLLADLWAVSSLYEARLVGPLAQWTRDGRVPTLPQQLLAQRMSRTVGNIFGLLELIEDPDDVRAARRSLLSSDAALRSRALEYLDNALSGAVRRYVFAVIDDAPPRDKLARAYDLFGIRSERPEETLARLIRIDSRHDPSAIGIVLAALYNVWDEQIDALYPLVGEVAGATEDPMVRETALWVQRRVESGPRPRGVLATGGDSDMAPMAQIEMMVFLQGVDLFAHCNAEEVLRLAAIATEEHFEKNQVIYRRDDPADKLFCVVEGRVRLEADGERRTVIGANGRFGVFDILSGRPRMSDALATTDSRLLAIEAEDFFDLLSNNIEIVRALFASVVSLSDGANERLL